MKKTIIALGALAVLGAGISPAHAADAEAIYDKKCKMCHTFDKKKVGPAFKDMNKDAAALKDMIVNGKKMMPKFGEKLSAEEIDAMVAFIKSKQ